MPAAATARALVRLILSSMLLRALLSMFLLSKFILAVAMVEVMVHSETVGVRFVLILLIRVLY